MSCEPSADWAGLTLPVLQQILSLGGRRPLQLKAFLREGSTEYRDATAAQTDLLNRSLVCRRWREAVGALLQDATWAVTIQRSSTYSRVLASWAAQNQAPAAAPPDATRLWERVHRLAVEQLDVRLMAWAVTPGSLDNTAALLRDGAFLRRSAPVLQQAFGIPERLVANLAPYARLERVGLCEDYLSTNAKPHGRPMQLAALAGLRRLTFLQLELGIVELAAVPPQVTELALVEADRIQLPPAPGAAVTDRLLAAAEAQGLARLSLQAGSGSVVFEEADHAPLELELSHVARLLAEHSGGGGGGGGACWRVELGMRRDDVVRGLGSPRLELTRIAS